MRASPANSVSRYRLRSKAECRRYSFKLRSLGATHVIEFGPGKVLSGLVKRIDGDLVTTCVHDQASLDKALLLLA